MAHYRCKATGELVVAIRVRRDKPLAPDVRPGDYLVLRPDAPVHVPKARFESAFEAVAGATDGAGALDERMDTGRRRPAAQEGE